MKCPKCEGKMEKHKLYRDFASEFSVDEKGTKSDKVPDAYVCEKCRYVEFYISKE